MIKLLIKYVKWELTVNEKMILKHKLKKLKIVKRFNS